MKYAKGTGLSIIENQILFQAVIVINSLMLLAVIVGGLYFFYWIAVSRRHKKEEPQTTQELLSKRTIVSADGILEIDGIYRVCLQTSQVNMRTNSDMEKYMVWLSFRSFVSEIGLPFILLQLSQFIDVREYANWYRAKLEKAKLTPALLESVIDVIKNIETADEDKNSRDYSGYIVFQYDSSSDSIDSGVTTGNPQFDQLIRKISGKKIMTKSERRNLSRQVLAEAAHITAKYAEQIGMTRWQLNKSQVYDLCYKIIQKDYSAFTSVEEASDAQCFTPFHESVTKQTIQYEVSEVKKDAAETA